jgi:hypothetical protein
MYAFSIFEHQAAIENRDTTLTFPSFHSSAYCLYALNVSKQYRRFRALVFTKSATKMGHQNEIANLYAVLNMVKAALPRDNF